MPTTRVLGAAIAASLLLAATACGDDDDASTTTTTAEPQGPTAVEVTLTSDGIEGLPSELPAGLLEITLINETGDYSSLDFTRVDPGTTEEEFVAGLQPVFEGGEFPEFFESNAGVGVQAEETTTSTLVLREGEHIAWAEISSPDEEETEEPEAGADADETTTTAGEGGTSSTTEAEGEQTTTSTTTSTTSTSTTTTVAGEDEGAAGAGGPTGTLTGVPTQAEADDPAEEEPLADEPEGAGDAEAGEEGEEGEEGEDADTSEVITEPLTVTAGDEDVELPEADGEIVATDYEFQVTLDGPGTINFRNDGPEQFHHAVVMDFGTNDPADVEAILPAFLESETGDPSAIPGGEALDMDQVNFDFGGSGVFGPDGMAGTFEADVVEGNTYAIVCFIQDRTGGPPHAIAYDMWEVVQAGEATESSETTETTEG